MTETLRDFAASLDHAANSTLRPLVVGGGHYNREEMREVARALRLLLGQESAPMTEILREAELAGEKTSIGEIDDHLERIKAIARGTPPPSATVETCAAALIEALDCDLPRNLQHIGAGERFNLRIALKLSREVRP